MLFNSVMSLLFLVFVFIKTSDEQSKKLLMKKNIKMVTFHIFMNQWYCSISNTRKLKVKKLNKTVVDISRSSTGRVLASIL